MAFHGLYRNITITQINIALFHPDILTWGNIFLSVSQVFIKLLKDCYFSIMEVSSAFYLTGQSTKKITLVNMTLLALSCLPIIRFLGKVFSTFVVIFLYLASPDLKSVVIFFSNTKVCYLLHQD